MSASNRGGKSGRDKTAKSTHSLQNGKMDTSVAGIKNQVLPFCIHVIRDVPISFWPIIGAKQSAHTD